MSYFGLSKRDASATFVALFLAGIVSFGVFLLSNTSSRQESLAFRDLFSDRANDTHSKIVGRLTEASNALARYAARVEVVGIKNERFLAVDSDNYIAQLPVLSRIGIVDANLKTVWSYPPNLRNQINGFDQSTVPARKEAFAITRETRKPTLSHVVELRSGGSGSLIPVAIFRDNKFEGAVYGTVQAEKLLSGLLSPSEFSVELKEQGKLVYAKKGDTPPVRGFRVATQINLGVANFEIAFTPTEAYRQKHSSRTPDFILIFGELFALLLGLAVYNYLTGQNERLIELEWRKSMLQGAGHAVIAIDMFGIIQTFTRSAEILLGYSASEMVGKRTPSSFHLRKEVESRAAVLSQELGRTIEPGIECFTAKLTNSNLPDENEWTLVHKNHSLIPVSISATGVRNAAGITIGYVAIVTDLRAQKKGQKEIQMAHERLQRVIDSTGEGIWERDAITREIRFIDAQAKKILGFESHEKVDHVMVMARISAEDQEHIANSLLEHQAEQTAGFNIEFRVTDVKPVGRQRWVRARGRVNRNGQSAEILSTLSDVTDIVNARLTLENALKEARSAAESKAAFFSMMSHEIRTPLNGVIGMTDLLLETDLNTAQRTFADIVKHSGSSLLNLLNDILDFSKAESGNMKMETAEFSLASVVESQIELLSATAKGRNLSLASFISLDLPRAIKGDASRLGQTLLNLVSNAMKFTSHGGVTVAVSKVSRESVDFIRFEIEDTGIGLSADEKLRIFQPFVQANSSTAATYGGTGLGLSICKKLIESMDGTIGVISEKGKGAQFWFEIPLIRAWVTDPRSIGWEKLVGIKTLVIEDDPIDRDALFAYLKASKMLGSRAASFTEAVVQIKQAADENNPYQVVMVANVAPASIKYLAELDSSRTRVISMTKFGELESEVDFKAAGAHAIIAKPLKQSSLLNALVSVVTNEAVEPSESSHVAERATVRSNFKILVADDVGVNRLLTTAMLDFLGHSSTVVANGLEVLEALKSTEYDLILMDCQMPEMDGFEATRQIRESPSLPTRKIPIIALTANAMIEDAKLCIKAGMNDYISKPMKRDQLAAVLSKWLSPKGDQSRLSPKGDQSRLSPKGDRKTG